MKRTTFFFMITMLGLCSMQRAQQNNYKVLEGKSDTLQNSYFLKRLGAQFDLRRSNLSESVKSRKAILKRQKQMRGWFKNIVSELPRKNKLNIVTTKKEEHKNYTVKWVAFESLPNHHVTGLFYLPKNRKPPYPAVYIPCGHSFNGKANETYQKAARLFVTNGFAVLQADPICQGERLQYLDENGKPITEERMLMHEILGQHLMLTGTNVLLHELWDNIRCIDFLEQNQFVDKNKLAVAGNSGGGTQATYLAAFDRRIKTAVVSCYIATTEKKFATIGSQDGCQQLWGEGKEGIEEQDFLLMAAPIPIEILSATDDFFNKDGAKTAYNELKKAYTVLGYPEKVNQVFAEGKHGWQKPLREETVQWCKKWLMNDDAQIVEPDDIGMFSDDECNVTKSGQVLTSYKSEKSVTDLVKEHLSECKTQRKKFLSTKTRDAIIDKIKTLVGFEEIPPETNYKSCGIIEEADYTIEKLLLERDSKYNFYLPAVLFTPKSKIKKTSSAILIVSEYGKLGSTEEMNRVKSELLKGNSVLAVDVCNTGELKDGRETRYDNKEFWIAKLPLYEGKTLMTYRTEDILIAERFLKDKAKSIKLVSYGYTGTAALHAAILDGGFYNVELHNSIRSWEEIASSNYSANQIGNVVPAALRYYDLPDLIKLLTFTKVSFED
jgi:cephalosporin-C deacetylase-like acetyl esterase